MSGTRVHSRTGGAAGAVGARTVGHGGAGAGPARAVAHHTGPRPVGQGGREPLRRDPALVDER